MIVTPTKAGVEGGRPNPGLLDSRLRGNDDGAWQTRCSAKS
jgi:hypothetical protein